MTAARSKNPPPSAWTAFAWIWRMVWRSRAKSEARAIIAQAMKDLDFGKSERCIRINSIGSGLEKYRSRRRAGNQSRYDRGAKDRVGGPGEMGQRSYRIVRTVERSGIGKRPLAGRRGNCKGDCESKEDRRSGPASRSDHLRRRGLCRIDRRQANKGSDRSAVCAAGGRHGLCGE